MASGITRYLEFVPSPRANCLDLDGHGPVISGDLGRILTRGSKRHGQALARIDKSRTLSACIHFDGGYPADRLRLFLRGSVFP